MYVNTYIHINIGLGWNCCCMMGEEEFVCDSAGEKGAELLKDRVSKTLLKGAESQSTRFKWFIYLLFNPIYSLTTVSLPCGSTKELGGKD